MKLLELLEDISELVYVADPETYDMLYLNQTGQQFFGVTEKGVAGKKCYQVLQGRDTPCDFCTNKLLRPDGFYTWEKFNPITKRRYLLKDKLIRWDDGKYKRIEIAFTVDDLQAQQGSLDERLETERELLACVRELSSSTSFLETMERSLRLLGGFLQCDRVYMFEFDGEEMSNTHEWCAEGVETMKNTLQKLPRRLVKRWEEIFLRNENVVIRNLENLRGSDSEEYEVLHRQNVHSLVAAPLFSENTLIGYLGVDNPPPVLVGKIQFLFSTLSYLYANTIMRHRIYEQMKRLSYYDSLTGLHNRNSYIQDLKSLRQSKPQVLGVVFADVNGLKEINDSSGHEQGDERLRFVSRKVSEQFGEYPRYRLGGDEFLALCIGIGREDFERRTAALKESLLVDGSPAAAVGAAWSAEIKALTDTIGQADKDMYKDKRVYHGYECGLDGEE